MDNKRYGPFRITKDIGSRVFQKQLELPEGWMVHNVFNEDLLTQCVEPKFQGQHKDPAPLPMIINKEEEYEVEEVWKHRIQGCVKIIDDELSFIFLGTFLFYFIFTFLFHYFLYLEQLRLGLIGHTVTSVTT